MHLGKREIFQEKDRARGKLETNIKQRIIGFGNAPKDKLDIVG